MASNLYKLKIGHVNCQNILAANHFVEFKQFFEKSDYHIICMSETWLTPGITDSFVGLEGYNLYRCDRIGKDGGGVGLYVRRNIQTRILLNS